MKNKTTTILAACSCSHSTDLIFLIYLLIALLAAPAAAELATDEIRGTETAIRKSVSSASHTGSQLSAIAWRFYNNGKYKEAENFFRASLKAGGTSPQETASTLLGLGYTCLKLGRYREAEGYFRKAAAQVPGASADFKAKTAEGLFLSTLSSGDSAAAWTLLNSKTDNDSWQKKYRRPDIEIPLCTKAGDVNGALSLYRKYRSRLSQQGNGKKEGLFLALLRFMARHNLSSAEICSDMIDRKLPDSAIQNCLEVLRKRDIQSWKRLSGKAERVQPVKTSPPKVKKKEAPSYAMLAGRAFDAREYEKSLELCMKGLASEPRNLDLLLMGAWSAYHLEKWSQAEELFRRGLALQNRNETLLSGLCWSLIRQEKCGECVELLRGVKGTNAGSTLGTPLNEALKCAGSLAYRQEEWETASRWLEEYEASSDQSDPGIEEMLAWSYYNSESWEKADNAFARLLEREKRRAWIDARARAQSGLGNVEGLSSLYEKYYGNPCGDGHLGSFLYGAGVDRHAICRAAGCEDYIAAGITYRNRSGDHGQGRLDDWSLPALYARYRLSDQLVFRATGAFRHVSNKRHSDDFSDAYFSFLYEPAPDLHLSAGAGFTGTGALIGTRPLWHAGATKDTDFGEFTLTAYRSTVDDSLLSIAGIRAGHDNGIVCTPPDCRCDSGNCKWDQQGACERFGGVMRTGAYAAWKGDLWGLNLNALVDFEQLTGTRVRRNHRYLANLSGGTSFQVPDRLQNLLQPVWAGVYATWFRYERNLNYYTCGNGGYFSPRSFIATGPVLNIRTVEGRCWIASIDASAGYVNYIEDDGWQFPRRSGTERGCKYDGRSLNLLGFGFHGRSAWRLNQYLAIEARGGVDRSADFTEWGAALNLIIYPGRVAGLFFQGLPEAVPWLP